MFNRPITVTPRVLRKELYHVDSDILRRLDTLHLLKLIDTRIDEGILERVFSVLSVVHISPFDKDLTEEYFDSLVEQEKIVEVSPKLYQLDIEFDLCSDCETKLYNPMVTSLGTYVCVDCFVDNRYKD